MIYGNPSLKVVHQIKDSILLREWSRLGVFDSLKLMPYPGDEFTKRELWHMMELQKMVDPVRLTFCQKIDEYLYEAMSELLASYGITEDPKQIEQNLEVYEPIIHYLKVVYNRPRPFQTAGAWDIPLYPLIESKNAGTPSYPSGHVLLALFFRHIYMKRHPELSRELMWFALDVKKTREEIGVHYPSDGLFSMKIYSHLKPWIDARTSIYSKGLDNINGY